jgi:hypothetical protein
LDDKINNDENNNNEPSNELIIGGCKVMFDPKIIIIFLLPQMQMKIFEERMKVKIDAINSFCDLNDREVKYFNYSYENRKLNNSVVSISYKNIGCDKNNLDKEYANLMGQINNSNKFRKFRKYNFMKL